MVGALGVRVRIEGDLPPEVPATLVDLREPDPGTVLPTLVVGRQAGGWTIDGSPETSRGLSTTVMALADDLVAGLNRLGLNGDRERLHVHAAVVDRGDAGIVLCAPSKSGKSTLAAALLEMGCSYLTDETATLIPGSSTLLAYPKPLALRGWAVSRFARQTPEHDDDRWVIPASSLGSVAASTRPRILVFPRYRPGGILELREVSRADAVHLLVEDLLDGGRFGSGALDELVLLVSRCTTWIVEFPDAMAAAETILTLPGASGIAPSSRWDDGKCRVATVGGHELRLDMEARHLRSVILSSATIDVDSSQDPLPCPGHVLPSNLTTILMEHEFPGVLAGVGAIALDHPEGSVLGHVEMTLVVPPEYLDQVTCELRKVGGPTPVEIDTWPPQGHPNTVSVLVDGAPSGVPLLDPIDRFIHLVDRLSGTEQLDPNSVRAVRMAAPRALPLIEKLDDRVAELGLSATWPDAVRLLARKVPGLPSGVLSAIAPIPQPRGSLDEDHPPALDTDGWEHVARRPTGPLSRRGTELAALADHLGIDARFTSYLAWTVENIPPLRTAWWLGIDDSSWALRLPSVDSVHSLVSNLGGIDEPAGSQVLWWGISGTPANPLATEVACPVSPVDSSLVVMGSKAQIREVWLREIGIASYAQVVELARTSLNPPVFTDDMLSLLKIVQKTTYIKRSSQDAVLLHGFPVTQMDRFSLLPAVLDAVDRALEPWSALGGGLVDLELAPGGAGFVVRAIGGRV